MNTLRRFTVFVHVCALEILLTIAILSLIGQLGWPGAIRWWHRPRPGTVGIDQFDSTSLAKDFVIFLPKSYQNGRPWPLVVFLHGSGDRGQDPTRIRERGLFGLQLPAIVVAPQCLPSAMWEPETVVTFVRHVASRYHVDRDRIYTVGYSMGSFGAWRTAAAHPELFAAIVPIAGGGDPATAKALIDTPIWAFHGADDKTVPVEESKRMIEAVRKAGGKPQLSIIPDEGHGICDSVCRRKDMWDWVFRQDLGKRKIHGKSEGSPN